MADIDELSDEQLLHRSFDDPSAFGLFYDRYFEVILAFLYRRTFDPHVAADLAAETFAQALRSRGRFHSEDGNARSWIFAIARHQLSHLIRESSAASRALFKLRFRQVVLDDTSIERIEALIDLDAERPRLIEVLERLSPKLADAVLLRVAHEMSFEDIAERLGCSQAAARVRVSRGLTRLQDMVGTE